MSKLAVLFFFVVGGPVIAQDYLDTVFIGGSVENRINLVFVSEGYTQAELPAFREFVISKFEGIFETEPFYREYRMFFNCFAIMAASRESGVDCAEKGISKDTRFDASACGFSVPRFNIERLNAVVRKHAPQYDVILLTVNNTQLRAAAWAAFGRLVIRANQTQSVINHEIGHVLGDLADEYSGTGGNGTGFVGKPNATQATALAQVPWQYWVESEIPLPTPTDYRFVDREAVGLFEGANYNPTGWYRPKFNCLMRQGSGEDGQRLCPICREAVIRRQFGPNGLNFVDGKSPARDYVTVDGEKGGMFSINPVLKNHPDTQIKWKLNGWEIKGAEGASYRLSTEDFPYLVEGGSYQLTAEFHNATPYVRSPDNGMMRERYEWNLNVRPSAEYQYPHKLGYQFQTQGGRGVLIFDLPMESRVDISIFDTHGNRIRSYLKEQLPAGHYRKSADNSLAPGVYFYRMEAVPVNGISQKIIRSTRALHP